MVAASKIFELPLNQLHCSQIPLHEGRTCFQSFLEDLLRFTISGLRYYSPLVLAPILMKWNKMDKATVLNYLRLYLETVFASSTVTASTFAFICLFRNLSGKFNAFAFILSIYCSAQICCFVPKRPLKLFTMAITQVALEIVLKQWTCTQLLLNSKSLQTLWFMLSSTVLMHFKRNGQYSGFWFIQPATKLNLDSEHKAENHNSTDSEIFVELKKHLSSFPKLFLKDAKTYLTYGLSLDFFSAFLKTKKPNHFQHVPKFLMQFWKATHFNMTYFFVTYNCLYRLTLYYFLKTTNRNEITDLQHVLAASVGAISYAFVNKLTLNTFAFVLAVQVAWQSFCQTSADEDTKENHHILEVLKKLPFNKMLFPLGATCAIGSFFFRNDSVNSLGKALVRAISDDKIQRVYDYIVKNTEDSILRNAATMPKLGVF